MKHILHIILSLLVMVMIGGCAGIETMTGSSSGVAGDLGSRATAEAIREALKLSVQRASANLSRRGGYLNNEDYHITMPESLNDLSKTMKMLGLGKPLEQVETAMNTAAEHAAKEAEMVMLQAVDEMSIVDAMNIVSGDETAATRYFEQTTRSNLEQRYSAILKSNLEKLSFYPAYRTILSGYNSVPVQNKPELDLEEYAVNYGLEALYRQIAVEERKIRNNPVEEGSQLIQKVFDSAI